MALCHGRPWRTTVHLVHLEDETAVATLGETSKNDIDPLAVAERTIRSWEDFGTIVSGFEQASPVGGRYAFRGHADERWALQTSLMRALQARPFSPAEALAVERHAMSEFQTQAHLYVPPRMLFGSDDAPSHWALMQHYGAPTRLLDWTRSPYVAAYFAVEPGARRDGAVWVLDIDCLHSAMADRYPEYWPLPSDKHERAKVLLNAEPARILYVTNLRFQTDRMAAQQQLFTVSPQILADHGHSITEALAGWTGQPWQKLIIPAELHADSCGASA
jgi:hypothetical protein